MSKEEKQLKELLLTGPSGEALSINSNIRALGGRIVFSAESAETGWEQLIMISIKEKAAQ